MPPPSASPLSETQLSKIVPDAAFKGHPATDPGLPEPVHEATLAHGPRKAGLRVERQEPIPIRDDGRVFEDKVIVEPNSVENLAAVRPKRALTRPRLSGKRLGRFMNFVEARLKHGIKRVVKGVPEDSGSGVSSVIGSFFGFHAS